MCVTLDRPRADVRYCANPHCRKELARKPGEPPFRWRDRTTCDRKCGNSVGGLKGAATRRGELYDSLV